MLLNLTRLQQVGGVDETCKWIVGGLCLAIIGMAGYIVKQHVVEREILRSWIKSMQDHLQLLGLLETAAKKGGKDVR